jgi:hypothetical protein
VFELDRKGCELDEQVIIRLSPHCLQDDGSGYSKTFEMLRIHVG